MISRAFILRIISIVMVAALAVVIIVNMSGSSGSDKPIGEVASVVIPLFENEYSEVSPERMFKKNFGFNAADYEGVVLYSPKSNMDAQEMLIVKFKSEAQAQEVIDSINSRIQSQMNIYEGYAPEEYDLCKKAVIDHQGNYLLYVVHDECEKIDEAFRKALK